MGTVIFAVTTGIFAFLTLKWKITSLILCTWMQKNECAEPTAEDLRECGEFVKKNLRAKPADLFKH